VKVVVFQHAKLTAGSVQTYLRAAWIRATNKPLRAGLHSCRQRLVDIS